MDCGVVFFFFFFLQTTQSTTKTSAVVGCEQSYVILKDWLSFGIKIALIEKQLISIWKDTLCSGALSCAHLAMQPTLYFKMNE